MDLVDFNQSFFASLELLDKSDFCRAPLSLSGRESRGLVAKATAAVLSLASFAVKRAALDLRTD